MACYPICGIDLAMSSTGGLCSSFSLFSSPLCHTIPQVSRSKINQPHNTTPFSTHFLCRSSYGSDHKVHVTFLSEYGCSRMGLSPPILYGYGYCPCPCSGSMFGILDPCRLPWLLLGFMDGEIDDFVEGFVLLVGGFLLFGMLGSVWHRNLTTELLRAIASGGYSCLVFWIATLGFLKWVGLPSGPEF